MVNNWSFLFLSLIGFILAPFLVSYGKTRRSLYLFVDGFTLSSIVLVTFFHLIPESIQQEGIWAFIFFILGFLPSKLFHSTQNRLLVFVLFLLAHTLLESSVVAMSNTNTLALTVGIHNLPIGIFLFTKVLRENGKKFAIGTVVFIFLFAILGFTLGESIHSIQKFQFHLQAFIASNVIHILFESIHEKFGFHNLETNSKYHIPSTLGAIAGILLIAFFSNKIFLTQKLQNSNRSVFSVLLKILLETSPILLLAFFLSGILRILLTPNTSNWLKNGSPFIQSLKGVIFGLPLPICSCGILPLYKTLIQTGIPATAGMAFLIATPEIGLDALLITIPLLGVEFSIYRLISAFLVAFSISYFVGKGVPTCNISQTTEVKKILNFSEKIQLGLKYGFIELFDHIMPWILFGIMIASLFEFLVDYQTFRDIPNYVQIPLFALLGIPTYVCATGATPFVAIAVQKGISLGAGLAFLISGPATNITTFTILKNLHGKKIAYTFAIAILILSILLGFGVDFFAFKSQGNQKFLEENVGLLNWVSLICLGILFLYSLLRIGPRGVLHQIEEHY